MALKDIHLAMPEDLVDRLGSLAKVLDVSRNLLVREALEDYLVRKEREQLDRELDEYVHRMAPYSGEFVNLTGPEVDRMLLESTEW